MMVDFGYLFFFGGGSSALSQPVQCQGSRGIRHARSWCDNVTSIAPGTEQNLRPGVRDIAKIIERDGDIPPKYGLIWENPNLTWIQWEISRIQQMEVR
jgi:hypothetical protein